MTDPPQAAVDAVAQVHHRLHCPDRGVWGKPPCDGQPTELDIAASRQLLGAAEQAWPHEAAQRDPASTTSAVTQVATASTRYHRFGFGPAHITSTAPGGIT